MHADHAATVMFCAAHAGRRTVAVIVASVVVVLLAAGLEPAAADAKRRTCAPRDAEVFASNRFGAVYQERGEDLGLSSCTTGGHTFHQAFLGAAQLFSLDIGGRFFAYAESRSDDDAPEGITNIFTHSLSGRRRSAFTILGSAPPVSVLVDVTKMRVAANQALVWIACEGAFGFGRLLPQCVRDGRRRWLYARPASASFETSFVPQLIATGRHIDARHLRLSSDGRTVTWRQQGKLKHQDIGA